MKVENIYLHSFKSLILIKSFQAQLSEKLLKSFGSNIGPMMHEQASIIRSQPWCTYVHRMPRIIDNVWALVFVCAC